MAAEAKAAPDPNRLYLFLQNSRRSGNQYKLKVKVHPLDLSELVLI